MTFWLRRTEYIHVSLNVIIALKFEIYETP